MGHRVQTLLPMKYSSVGDSYDADSLSVTPCNIDEIKGTDTDANKCESFPFRSKDHSSSGTL